MQFVIKKPYFIFLFILSSCSKVFFPKKLEYQTYNISTKTNPSETLNTILLPYADSVNKSMNNIIGFNENELIKKQPEGSLGNFLADALLLQSKLVYGNIDASFVNSGGIRVNSIPAGAITKGKIFEVAPFDNTIVILNISGKILNEFINHISARGGWPTAGASWQIANKKAQNILINNLPIDELAVYRIAVVDYVANGGDDCKMLEKIPREEKGFLFRDAVLQYIKSLNESGKKIVSKIENRVTNAE